MDVHDENHENAGICEQDHIPQPNGRLTGWTVATVRDSLSRNGILTRADDETIARHFVQAFFDGDAFVATLAELRNAVEALDGCPDDVPDDPLEFCRWVRKELLELEHLPREKLAELYQWATDDLLLIEETIAFCNEKIAGIKNRSLKTDADPTEIRFFKHFRSANQDAREELISALTHRMQKEALRAAFGNPFSTNSLSFFQHHPWSYRDRQESFDPRSFSPVRHMLLDLPLRRLREAQRLYQAGEFSKFDDVLQRHIEESVPVVETRKLLEEHHLLAARKTVLIPALDAYERGELELFSNVVATQIEGLIEDACNLSDVPLEQTRLATIIGKLDALTADALVNIDYTYFAYKFPVIRNRVAHGRMLAADSLRTGRMLLLDLRYCCRLVYSHRGARNAIVRFLRTTNSGEATTADCLEFAVLYAQVAGGKPDPFYDLEEEFTDFELLLEQEPMWKFLHQLVQARREDLDTGLNFLAGSLGTLRPALRESCSAVLKSLSGRGKESFDALEFVGTVRSQAGHDSPVHTKEIIQSRFLSLLHRRMALEIDVYPDLDKHCWLL